MSMHRSRFARASGCLLAFGLVCGWGAKLNAASPPGPDLYELRFQAMDESGRPVVPDRISCEVVWYPRASGFAIWRSPCQGWKAGQAPSVRIEQDGTGRLSMPEPFRAATGTLGFPRVFFRLHAGTRQSGVTSWDRWEFSSQRVHEGRETKLQRFVFFDDLGGPPVVVSRPRVQVLEEALTFGLAHAELSVDFEDPDGDPMRISWIHTPLPYGARSETTRARLFLGKGQQTMVEACDQRGACTIAFLPFSVLPNDVPPGAGWIPGRPLFPSETEGIPRRPEAYGVLTHRPARR